MNIKIRDDNGRLWSFNRRKSRIICEGDRTRGGGLYCYDVFEGLEVLIEKGYIRREKNKVLIIAQEKPEA